MAPVSAGVSLGDVEKISTPFRALFQGGPLDRVPVFLSLARGWSGTL